MKLLLKSSLLLIGLYFGSCADSKVQTEEELPTCIANIVADKEVFPQLIDIKVNSANNETHYWLHSGSMHVDGLEYIVNASCDTICFVGGLRPPEDERANCFDNYTAEWEVVWTQEQ